MASSIEQKASEETGQKSNKELLADLGVEVKKDKKSKLTPKQERIIAGFEEIQQFVEEHGHKPEHGEDKDIFERLYATRLDQIVAQSECRELVSDLDYQGLLSGDNKVSEPKGEYKTDKELLEELGVPKQQDDDVSVLKHVKPRAEVRAAEEIANRTPCKDFEKFKPLFESVQRELDSGVREAKVLTKNAKVNQGDFFVLFGQKVFVADVSDERVHGFDGKDFRLRVIYDNATESDLLLRSLQRALDRDEAGRRIIEPSAGPLFDDVVEDEDSASGTIYVLRSKSDHPTIAASRDVIHKIGVTGGDVKNRITNASKEATYLLADVDVVATYDLFNINRNKLEKLLHKFFESARLDIEIKDRFGHPVEPKEWFIVPLSVIDEVVERVKDGSISEYQYDQSQALLIKV